MSITKLNVAQLTTPKKLRSGRISQVTEKIITGGTGGGGGTVDLTGLMKLTSPTEQVVDSPVTVTKDFKAFNIYEGGVKLSDKYITPVKLEARIAALVDAAPITLDTLNELAAALGDDPNFATTITNLIGTKAPIDNPVFTGIPKVGTNVMYHAGNLNKSDIDFKARGIESNYLVTSQFILFNNEYKTFLDVFNSSEQSAFTTNVTRATDGFSLAKTVLSDNNYSISFASSNHTPYNIYHAGNSNLSTVNWLAKDLTAAGTLQSSTYSGTGLTASGWQIDNAGNANIKSLTVRELARFYELEVDKIRCINGGLAITPANGIVSKITGSTLFFDDVPQFAVGDIVRAQKWTNGVRGFKAPVTAIDTIAKSVTLGTFITGDLSQIKIGDEIIVWNSSVGGRDGLIYMSANDAGSPFIDVVKNEVIKCRIGNIGGMLYNGVNIPVNTMGYFADGDVYIKSGHFTGEVTITGSGGNIASKEDVANAKTESISTATANATDIADAAKEEAIDAGHTITSRMIGSLTNSLGTLAYQSKVEAAQLGTTLIQGGYIRTDCLNVNDIIVGLAKSTDVSAAQTAAINSANTNTSNVIGNKFTYINGTGVYTGTLTANQVNAIGITALGNVTAGSFNIGSGKFVVDAAGNLTANNANMTGTINSTAGIIAGFTIAEGRLFYTNGFNRTIIMDKYQGIGVRGTDGAWINFLSENGSGYLGPQSVGLSWNYDGNFTFKTLVTGLITNAKSANMSDDSYKLGGIRASDYLTKIEDSKQGYLYLFYNGYSASAWDINYDVNNNWYTYNEIVLEIENVAVEGWMHLNGSTRSNIKRGTRLILRCAGTSIKRFAVDGYRNLNGAWGSGWVYGWHQFKFIYDGTQWCSFEGDH